MPLREILLHERSKVVALEVLHADRARDGEPDRELMKLVKRRIPLMNALYWKS